MNYLIWKINIIKLSLVNKHKIGMVFIKSNQEAGVRMLSGVIVGYYDWTKFNMDEGYIWF